MPIADRVPRRPFLVAVLLVLASIAAFLGYLGYFGGAVFEEVPATARPLPSRRGLAAVVVSGDMGFHIGMGPRIAERLAADGIPVIGVNAMAYFRDRRTPGEVAQLIASATERALTYGKASRVILIGQSFGADMLHLGLTALPPRLRSKVQMVALVVPTTTVFLRISPAEMFDWTRPDAEGIVTAKKLTWVPAICIRGLEEKDSLCPQLHQPNVRQVALPGGHPLHWDADRLYAALTDELDRTRYITESSVANHSGDMRSPPVRLIR